MNDLVRLAREGNIGIVTVDHPPVNAISHAVRAGLVDAIAAADADDAIAAVVLACAGRTFMAGADITEFGRPWKDPGLPEVVEAVEACSKPVIAAIHGTALGGGFEVALGCHYRCALPGAKVGFPEVNLGLLPGAQGTQRLPRLTGVPAALDAVVSGRPVPARKALALGAVDEIIDGDLLPGAIAYAQRLLERGAGVRRLSEMPVAGDPPDAALFAEYRQSIARKTRGYFAPERCIQALEAAAALPFAEGVRKERELFAACMASPESAAQRHVFFGERAVARIPDLPRDTSLRTIERVAVIGGGTMGSGIAMAFADAGLPVVLKEISEEALERTLDGVRQYYAKRAAKGRLSDEDAARRTGLVTGTLAYADLADADLIIEAVFENMALKKRVFGEIDEIARPGAILATNTSTLDVNEIAGATGRPGDVIGLHFFSPANLMRLLEVVRGAATSNDVLATAMKLAKRIRKVGVVSGVCFGFIGNRMFGPYIREANMLLLEGATPEQIDAAMTDFGFALGPCGVSDLAGLDVGYKIRGEQDDLPDDPRYYRIENVLVEAGRNGQKNGKGFYLYEQGSYAGQPDPEVHALIRREAEQLGVAQREIDDGEIVSRCLCALINEGADILDEGIALRPVDIDMVYVCGYGFPPYRGGPMFYADALGLAEVRDAINGFAERLGNEHGYWTVSPLLGRLADAGKEFA